MKLSNNQRVLFFEKLILRAFKMVKCKITVLKRTFHEDLAKEYLQIKTGPCGEFEDGQEFITESPTAKPDSFPCSCSCNCALIVSTPIFFIPANTRSMVTFI